MVMETVEATDVDRKKEVETATLNKGDLGKYKKKKL